MKAALWINFAIFTCLYLVHHFTKPDLKSTNIELVNLWYEQYWHYQLIYVILLIGVSLYEVIENKKDNK